MTRIARVVVPGWPHHVTQRGNRRQTVFFSDQDRQMYLRLLLKYLPHHHTSLIGFSMMGNHVHLIPVPERSTALAKAVGQTNNDYSRWRNLQSGFTGHLWQARFFSCPIEPADVWRVLRYVELNPVRAGLVQAASDWPWSSARAHLTGHDESGLLDMWSWAAHFTPQSWAEFLFQEQTDKDLVHQIRTFTQTGRPFADEISIQGLEQRLGRSLRPMKRGPKKVFR